MAKVERLRQNLTGTLDVQDFEQRIKDGWEPTAIEWQRHLERDRPQSAEFMQEVPFGLQVAKDCVHLEENPAENRALTLMTDLIVDDHSLSEVADALNQNGFRTRQGLKWSPVAVFNMLPRLIEAGPRIFSSKEWEARSQRLARAAAARQR